MQADEAGPPRRRAGVGGSAAAFTSGDDSVKPPGCRAETVRARLERPHCNSNKPESESGTSSHFQTEDPLRPRDSADSFWEGDKNTAARTILTDLQTLLRTGHHSDTAHLLVYHHHHQHDDDYLQTEPNDIISDFYQRENQHLSAAAFKAGELGRLVSSSDLCLR